MSFKLWNQVQRSPVGKFIVFGDIMIQIGLMYYGLNG